MNCDRPVSLPLHYFLRVPNFGDLLNPLLISALSDHEPFWVVGGNSPHLLAIGSLMASATPQSFIWGTGVMHPDLGLGSAQADHIHALRGPLSHQALRRAGLALGDVPFGDPAILAPHILGIARQDEPRYHLGLVAHYVDRQQPSVRSLLARNDVADINVHLDPLAAIRAMADCQVIVSSSLHGLIVAEALGLPSLWIKASDDIAGDDFKFADWFATTRNPQRSPHLLQTGNRAEDLARMAEPRDHSIDFGALVEAYSTATSFASNGPVQPAKTLLKKSVVECRRSPTPVFLISFNRGSMLQQVVSGLRALSTELDIIVHDNGSNDRRTLDVLDELEREGLTVYRYPAIENANQLDQVNESVERYFSDWAEPSTYIVSDCDVDISIAAPDVISVYKMLLNRFRKVACVGPMLRIRDIPEDYPLKNRALNRHIDQFWRHEPQFCEVNGRNFAYQNAIIDTTFALHRAGEPFHRLKSAIRVYEPFEALHLDWYIGTTKSGDDETYSRTSHPHISHWNNVAETQEYEREILAFDHFYWVRADDNGELEVRKEMLSLPGSG